MGGWEVKEDEEETSGYFYYVERKDADYSGWR